jgi:pimeloyl-ACP methyl ester carboxylesterase
VSLKKAKVTMVLSLDMAKALKKPNFMLTFHKRQGFESRFIDSPFGRFHFLDSNPAAAGVPLILVHGIGSNSFSWLLQAALFKNYVRLIIPDLYDFNEMSVSKSKNVTLSEHVDSLLFLMDSLQISQAHFCGLSLGGWISARLGQVYPNRVGKLVLLNPAGVNRNTEQIKTIFETIDLKTMEATMPLLMSQYPKFNLGLLSGFAEFVVKQGTKKTLFQILSGPEVKRFLRSVVKGDFLDEFPLKLKAPTLLLWGKNDGLLPYSSPQVISDISESTQAFYVEGCGHILCVESPVTLAKEINRFLGLNPKLDSDPLLQFYKRMYPEHVLLPISA